MSNDLALFNIGARYGLRQVLTADLMTAFRDLSGDDNPMHLDRQFAMKHGFLDRIAYGNLLGAMLSRLVGTTLPTRAVVILRQSLDYRQPVYVGDEVNLTAEVTTVHEAVSSVQFKLQFHTAPGDPVCTGQCLIKCL